MKARLKCVKCGNVIARLDPSPPPAVETTWWTEPHICPTAGGKQSPTDKVLEEVKEYLKDLSLLIPGARCDSRGIADSSANLLRKLEQATCKHVGFYEGTECGNCGLMKASTNKGESL